MDKDDHPLFHCSQAEVAQFFRVDRTTIRAWTKDGMPFKEATKGKPAEYDASIVFRWRMWKKFDDAYRLPPMSPLKRLAVGRAFDDKDKNPFVERQARREFAECFRTSGLTEFFSSAEIEEAIAYASALFDMVFYGDRRR